MKVYWCLWCYWYSRNKVDKCEECGSTMSRERSQEVSDKAKETGKL